MEDADVTTEKEAMEQDKDKMSDSESAVISRKQKFHKDCQSLITLLHEMLPKLSKTACSVNCESFQFSASLMDDNKKVHDMEIYGCADYPEFTMFTCTSCARNDDEPVFMSKTVLEIFSFFSGEHGLPELLHASISGSGGADLSLSVDDSDDEEAASFYNELHGHGPIQRFDSMDRIELEINEIKAKYGSTAVLVRRFGDEHADITLLIDSSSLKGFVRDAWHLDAEEPLALKLIEVPARFYRLSQYAPKAKVYIQSNESRVFAVGMQLERITEAYLRRHWRSDNPSGENFLLKLMKMLVGRLSTLSDYCLICDQPHSSPMIMLSVCQRALCAFAYDEFGLMADVAAGATELDVIVLLLGLLQAAAYSPRQSTILDPFPMVRDPLNHEELCLDPETRDIKKLREVLTKLPCAQMLAESNSYQGCLKDSHVWAWRLLCWTVASNRAYLVRLKKRDVLNFMGTSHQFFMITDNPAKELKFRKAKEEHGGSIFLFHGSPIENWHSILRHGLINASKTNKQIHGAVLGEGVYLSPHSVMSLEYSTGTRSKVNREPEGKFLCVKRGLPDHSCTHNDKYLKLGEKLVCLAICEVVDSQNELVKHHDGRWLLKNPDHCCTRFLFVGMWWRKDVLRYPGEESSALTERNVLLTQAQYTNTLREVVDRCMQRNSGHGEFQDLS